MWPVRFPEERERLARLASSGEIYSLKSETQDFLGRLWDSEVEDFDVKVLLVVLGSPIEVSRRDCWSKDRERKPDAVQSQVSSESLLSVYMSGLQVILSV